tara:strand:- start:59 stop:310 length:252 start_codon:yes stop_codon:yes gene_type:complete
MSSLNKILSSDFKNQSLNDNHKNRRNIGLSEFTYKHLTHVQEVLIEINKVSPFTDKSISKHDVIKWLLKDCAKKNLLFKIKKS